METKEYLETINSASVKHWERMLGNEAVKALLRRVYIHPEPGATMVAVCHPMGAYSRRIEAHRLAPDQLSAMWGEYVYEGSIKYLIKHNKNRFELFDYLPCLHELGRTLHSDGCGGTKLPLYDAFEYISGLPQEVQDEVLTEQRESVLHNIAGDCGYDKNDEYVLEQARKLMLNRDPKHNPVSGYFSHGWRDAYGDSLFGEPGCCVELRSSADIGAFLGELSAVHSGPKPYEQLPATIKLPFILDSSEGGMVWTALHKHSHNPTGARWVRMRIGKALRAAFPWMSDDLVRRLSMLASTPKMFRGRDMRLFKLAYLNNYDLTGSCMGHNDVTDYDTGMLYPWMCYALSNYEIALAVQPTAPDNVAELHHSDVIGYTLLMGGATVGSTYGDYDRVTSMLIKHGVPRDADMTLVEMPLVAVPKFDEGIDCLTLVVPYLDSVGYLNVHEGKLTNQRCCSIDCQNSDGSVNVDVDVFRHEDILKAFNNYSTLIQMQAKILGVHCSVLDPLDVAGEVWLTEPSKLRYVRVEYDGAYTAAQEAVCEYSRALG